MKCVKECIADNQLFVEGEFYEVHAGIFGGEMHYSIVGNNGKSIEVSKEFLHENFSK